MAGFDPSTEDHQHAFTEGLAATELSPDGKAARRQARYANWKGGYGVSKRSTRGLGEALRIAGQSKTASLGLEPGPTHGVEQPGGPAMRPAPQRQRGQRRGRTGIVVYLENDTHFQLKRMALESRCSLQELCTRGVMSLLSK